MPFVWSIFIKLGISEAIMRLLTEVLPSILLVYFSYRLGASLFNKKVGLFVGYFTSIYWVIQFYGARFMTDIPAMLFGVMAAYFFWEYYVKRAKPYGLYLAIFFGVLGFLTRFPTVLVTVGILVYLLAVKKQKFFTDKTIWIAGLVGLASLFPYFLYNKMSIGSWFPAGAFYGSQNVTVYAKPAWLIFQMLPSFIGWMALAITIFGIIISLFNIFLGIDVFWKQKNNSINSHYFVLSWIFFQVLYFVFIIKTGNDRWVLLWMPPLFIYFALGLEKISNFLEKYHKMAGLALIIIVLAILGHSQMVHGDQLIKSKLDSYKEVKDTGLWLRENTPENAKIMAASIVQNTYYSQRRTYDFYTATEIHQIVFDSVVDPQGRIISSTYKTIRNETELECKMVRIRPDYLVLHVWEPEFTPDFMYSYPERNKDILEAVKAFERNGQLTAAIYKFTGYPKIDEKKVNCTWVYERPTNISGIPLSIEAPERLIIPS